jgi:hypothetical protein
MNRLKNRVSQATYRPRRSSPNGKNGRAESAPRTIADRLEGIFMEEVKDSKKDEDKKE